jgi:hypothetical protein
MGICSCRQWAFALSDQPTVDKVFPAPREIIGEIGIGILTIEGHKSLFHYFRIEADEITHVNNEHSLIPPLQ